MKTTRFKTLHCLTCGESLNASSRFDDAGEPPGVNDVSICTECQGVAVFCLDENGDLALRPVTEQDWKQIDLVELAQYQRKIERLNWAFDQMKNAGKRKAAGKRKKRKSRRSH